MLQDHAWIGTGRDSLIDPRLGSFLHALCGTGHGDLPDLVMADAAPIKGSPASRAYHPRITRPRCSDFDVDQVAVGGEMTNERLAL